MRALWVAITASARVDNSLRAPNCGCLRSLFREPSLSLEDKDDVNED